MKKILYIFIPFILIMLFLVACDKKNDSNGGSGENGSRPLLDSVRAIKIVQIEGTGTVTDEEGTINCYVGMNLFDGDKLDVNHDSVIVLKFDEDKYVYLGEDTTIDIKSEGKDRFKTNIYIEKGLVLAELQNKLGEDEEFFLSSNNSVMAVRGTVFGVSVKEVGDEIVETYSVYQGVTELFVFDLSGTEIIKGKLSDISNAKIEIRVPKSHIIPSDQFNNLLNNWLKDITDEFDDAEDANSKLDQVNITVGTPTRADYNFVIEKLGGIVDPDKPQPVYSDIQYTSEGFFGSYDGVPHGVTITPITKNSTVYYRGEKETEWKTTNDYEFVAPGSYRVYYKIVCEGYDDKIDFEVVYITDPNIIIDTDFISYDSSSKLARLDMSRLGNDSFNIYNGVRASDILSNAKYYIGNDEIIANDIEVEYDYIIPGYIELKNGMNTLHVTFDMIDYELSTDVKFLFIDDRYDLGYSVGINSDYVENLGGNLYYYNSPNLSYSDAGTYSITGQEFLADFGLDFDSNGLLSIYINSPYDTYSSKETGMADYDATNDVVFDMEQFYKVNLSIFPTSQTKGYNETIYVYTGSRPNDVPTYEVGNLNYAYNPAKTPDGVLMDFISSNNGDVTIKYSLDGVTYQESLYITEAGIHKVYYDVSVEDLGGDTIMVSGYEFVSVTVGQGVITSDNFKFITNPIYLISNDNRDLYYDYKLGDEGVSQIEIKNPDDKTISSLSEVYEVYASMILHSKYYDSITKEPIEGIDVYISDKEDNSADFNYTISAPGYDTITGTVRFDYSDFGYIYGDSNNDLYFDNPVITLPDDYDIHLTDEITTAIPTRPAFNYEGTLVNYQVYYSIDDGETWTTETPKLTESKIYRVYMLYCCVDLGNDGTDLVDGDNEASRNSSLSATGNFIVAIQHINLII